MYNCGNNNNIVLVGCLQHWLVPFPRYKLLAPYTKVLLEKRVVCSTTQIPPHVEPEASLPFSQKAATGSYSESY
jgi:hypothetical protein